MNSFTKQTISPNSPTILQVNGVLQSLNIVNEIIDAVQNHGLKRTVILEGYANVDNSQIPLSLTMSVGL